MIKQWYCLLLLLYHNVYIPDTLHHILREFKWIKQWLVLGFEVALSMRVPQIYPCPFSQGSNLTLSLSEIFQNLLCSWFYLALFDFVLFYHNYYYNYLLLYVMFILIIGPLSYGGLYDISVVCLLLFYVSVDQFSMFLRIGSLVFSDFLHSGR